MPPVSKNTCCICGKKRDKNTLLTRLHLFPKDARSDQDKEDMKKEEDLKKSESKSSITKDSPV